ncbi:MAG: hypothetical protein M0R06_11515 [Sphaerochaeta sp.]|jgi:hypothetical protein|nr:hypothetical protein [Sphaerochaeta sp.]MCK9599661.1 hypothetical protein [Sphaerochaeta sp.]
MAEPVKPEAGRQVSRDFDTIEHEPEMPLREQFHRVLSRMNLPTWGGGISWNEALNWMVLIIEAHDSAVAAKAVKDAKEALECAEYAFLHPTSNQEFALNAVQQALAHIRAMAEGKE